MNRETVLTTLQLVETARVSVEEAKSIVDGEALPVSDRNIIEHALTTMVSEAAVLARTLQEMLEDPTRSGSGDQR